MTDGRRPRLEGAWACGDHAGTFVFEIGPHDDYLLLRPAVGERLPDPLAGLHCDPAPDLSLRPEPDGRALGVLRLVWGAEAGTDHPLEARLAGLVAALRSVVLPGLAWGATERRLVFPTSAAAAPRPSPEAGEAAPVDGDDDALVRAAAALERGQFGWADRLAREALRTGDDTAGPFLEIVGAARRAARHVRQHPRDASAHLALGWALLGAGALESEAQSGREALRLDPALGCAHALVGLLRLLDGDRAGAEAAHGRALALAGAGDPHPAMLADALRGDSPLLAGVTPTMHAA